MGLGDGAKGHGRSPAELAAPLLSPQGGNACLQLHSPFHHCRSLQCSVGTWDNLPDPRDAVTRSAGGKLLGGV